MESYRVYYRKQLHSFKEKEWKKLNKYRNVTSTNNHPSTHQRWCRCPGQCLTNVILEPCSKKVLICALDCLKFSYSHRAKNTDKKNKIHRQPTVDCSYVSLYISKCIAIYPSGLVQFWLLLKRRWTDANVISTQNDNIVGIYFGMNEWTFWLSYFCFLFFSFLVHFLSFALDFFSTRVCSVFFFFFFFDF